MCLIRLNNCYGRENETLRLTQKTVTTKGTAIRNLIDLNNSDNKRRFEKMYVGSILRSKEPNAMC